MEGSPVLCAKLLLGKDGTESQNAAFYIQNNGTPAGSRRIRVTAGGWVILPRWRWASLWEHCTLSLCVF